MSNTYTDLVKQTFYFPQEGFEVHDNNLFFNGLDLRARHQLLAILRDLARGDTTLLLVTHQIEAIIPEISR